MNYDLIIQVLVLIVAIVGTYFAVKKQNKESINQAVNDAVNEAVNIEQRFSTIEAEHGKIKERILALEKQDKLDGETVKLIFKKIDELKDSVLSAMTSHLEKHHIGGKNA